MFDENDFPRRHDACLILDSLSAKKRESNDHKSN